MLHSFIGPMVPGEEPTPIPQDTLSVTPSSRYGPEIRFCCFSSAVNSCAIGRIEDESALAPRKRCGVDPLKAGFAIPTMPIDSTTCPVNYEECAQRQYDCYMYILSCAKNGGLKASLRSMAVLRALNIPPSAAICSSILQQCVAEANSDVAIEMFEVMNVLGIPISTTNLRLILSILEKSNRHFHAAAILMDLGDKAILDETTIKPLLSSLLKAPPTPENMSRVRDFLIFLRSIGTHVDPQNFFMLAVQHAQRSDSIQTLRILDEHCQGLDIPDWVITWVLTAVLKDTTVSPSIMLRNGLRVFRIAAKNGSHVTAEMQMLLLRCAYRAGEPLDALAIFCAAVAAGQTTQTMYIDAIRVVQSSSSLVLRAAFADNAQTRTAVATSLCRDMLSLHPFSATSAPEMLPVLTATLASILRMSLEHSDLPSASWVLRTMVEHDRGNLVGALTPFLAFCKTKGHTVPAEDLASAVGILTPVSARLLRALWRQSGGLQDAAAVATMSSVDWLHGVESGTDWLPLLLPTEGTTVVVMDGTTITGLLEGDAADKFVHMMSDYYHKGGGHAVLSFAAFFDMIVQEKKAVLRLLLQWSNTYPWLRIAPLCADLQAAGTRRTNGLSYEAENTLSLYGMIRGRGHKRAVLVLRCLKIEAYARGILQLKGVTHLHALLERIAS